MTGGSTNAINLREWREHTNYTGYKSKDKCTYWFWEIVEGTSDEQRGVLLHFWTAVRYWPADGFPSSFSKLSICKLSRSQGSLPTSRTCFYQLNLPAYQTKAIMKESGFS